MLCCAVCGTTVGRGERGSECMKGVMYQVWGELGVLPARFRVTMHELDRHHEAMSRGKKGFEDFRAICCACHLGSDYHGYRDEFLTTACQNCRAVVDGGFRNIRHRDRVVRTIMRA